MGSFNKIFLHSFKNGKLINVLLWVLIYKFSEENDSREIRFIPLCLNLWNRFFTYVAWYFTITALTNAKTATVEVCAYSLSMLWYRDMTSELKNKFLEENCQGLGEKNVVFLFSVPLCIHMAIRKNFLDAAFPCDLFHASLMSWEQLCNLTSVTVLQEHGKDSLCTL